LGSWFCNVDLKEFEHVMKRDIEIQSISKHRQIMHSRTFGSIVDFLPN
jgi:hypothetical protein